MKTILNTISILVLSLLIITSAEAQKKSAVPIEPEFVQFWKEFQKVTNKVNSEMIKSYTNDRVIFLDNISPSLCTTECVAKKVFVSITKATLKYISITDKFTVEDEIWSNNDKSIKGKDVLKEANIAVESTIYKVNFSEVDRYSSAYFAKIKGSYKIIAIKRWTD